MIKNFVTVVLLCFVFLSISVVMAEEVDQDVEVVVADIITFTIDPPTLNFGTIEYGSDVTHSGSDVTVDTTGSDTESNSTMLEVDVVGAFFEALLQFKENSQDVSLFAVLPFTPLEIP